METWEGTLSPEYHRTSDHPEVGFHMVFGDVKQKWYNDNYWQQRAKLQVQRQIRLLIFDLPDNLANLLVNSTKYHGSLLFRIPVFAE